MRTEADIAAAFGLGARSLWIARSNLTASPRRALEEGWEIGAEDLAAAGAV